MPDVHVPKLESHGRGRAVLRIVLEVVLISVGVFLGLLGEQWRENAHQHELAKETLRRFRAEVVENRKSVTDVAEYHATLHRELVAASQKPPEQVSRDDIHFNGIRPVRFDHSAWDLAIATQALAYVDSDLAFALAGIYRLQEDVEGLTRGVTQAMFTTPPINDSNSLTFFGSVSIYYGDIVLYEPRLLAMYDAILPKIDASLGEKK